MPERETMVRDILREDCLSATLYDHYSKIAEKEGYLTIAETLRQMRDYKETHARLWLDEPGLPENTCTALESALLVTNTDKERYERYATQVQDKTLAVQLRQVAQCEKTMEDMLLQQIAQVQQVSTGYTHGHCCRCGYPCTNETPPFVCPVCGGKHSFLGK